MSEFRGADLVVIDRTEIDGSIPVVCGPGSRGIPRQSSDLSRNDIQARPNAWRPTRDLAVSGVLRLPAE